ncbi:MAG: hypothetical protein U0992_08230 [Planctomycetaceae bacterium]
MPKAGRFRREIPLYTTAGVHNAEVSTHPFTTADGLGLSLCGFIVPRARTRWSSFTD